MLLFFVETRRAFAMQKLLTFFQQKNIPERSFNAKASHIFSTKNIGIFEILVFEIFKNLLNVSLSG